VSFFFRSEARVRAAEALTPGITVCSGVSSTVQESVHKVLLDELSSLSLSEDPLKSTLM
jgi:hypothetical protein